MVSRPCNLRDNPSTSSYGLLARPTLPDSDRLTLHRVLPAECANVPGVLGDFDFFHLLSQRGTVSNKRQQIASAFLTLGDGCCHGSPSSGFKRVD